jgi:hypothetical protein
MVGFCPKAHPVCLIGSTGAANIYPIGIGKVKKQKNYLIHVNQYVQVIYF